LPEVMALLARDAYTGSLVATTSEGRREILYTDGEIRAARSHVEEEKLGRWLVGRNLITESEMALTLLAQGGVEAPPLGHLLVTRGCIDQDRLEAELEELALTIIYRAASPQAESGLGEDHFKQPDTLPNLTTTQIILYAARKYGDDQAKQEALGSLEQSVWPATGLTDMLQDLDLTPTEAFLLSRLDGTHKISVLISVSALPADQAVATLYALKAAGLVNVGRPSHPAKPSRETLSMLRAAELARITVDESRLTSVQVEERSRIRRLAMAVPRVDHYEAIGVERTAPASLIDEAWQTMQSKYSPDRASMPHLRDMRGELTAVYERAGEAYAVLSRSVKRKRYDDILKRNEEANAPKKAVSQEARSELVEANIKRADELIRDGEPFLAIQMLEQACNIDPRPDQLTKLATLLMRNPLWCNRAMACLRKATDINPKYAEAWVALSDIWRQRNNPERRRKSLERALAADPHHERACKLYKRLVGEKELKFIQRRAQMA
jgi:tetratricopeptide (TPR) repeat protein